MAAPAVTRDEPHSAVGIRDRVILVESAGGYRQFNPIAAQRQDAAQSERNPDETVVRVDVVIRASNLGRRMERRSHSRFDLEMAAQSIPVTWLRDSQPCRNTHEYRVPNLR